MIPRLVHFVWVGKQGMPAWARRNIAEFARLNGGMKISVHDELSISPRLASLCASLDDPAMKADLIRLSVLHEQGGWYFDVDTWPLRPLADAELAFGLDGSRVLATRQDHIKTPLNNCVMSCAPGAAGIAAMIDEALITPRAGRCTYGPDLLSRMAARMPWAFITPPWPWFLPAGHKRAWRFYQHAVRGYVEPLRHAAGTDGQLPFSMHLWLNGDGAMIDQAFANEPDTRPLALVEMANEAHAMSGMAQGLAALGYRVERYEKRNIAALRGRVITPAVVVMWNNVRNREFYDLALSQGARVLVMEAGFFDRANHVQVDQSGFLHWASWAGSLGDAAPADGADRLAKFLPGGPVPMRERSTEQSRSANGYVLVLGQVPGDSQLEASEIKGPVPLQEAVARALPAGLKAYFRPHPQCLQRAANSHHKNLPILDSDCSPDAERDTYKATKHGSQLAAALAGAKFVITINSNAILEALASGVPVLAFGPHLGITAGVVRRATLATIKQDIDAMLRGWRPADADVRRFLEHLACRQYSRAQLADANVLTSLGIAACKTC